MYFVTFKERPIVLREICSIEGDPHILLPRDEYYKLEEYLAARIRKNVFKKFREIFGYNWNSRCKILRLHEFTDYGRLVADVTDTAEWQANKAEEALAKRIVIAARTGVV